MPEPAAMFQPSRLTGLRELRGLSKVQLARRIGCTAGAISHFEDPRRCDPSADTLEALSLALGVPRLAFFAADGWPELEERRVFFRRRTRISQRVRRQVRRLATLRLDVFRCLADLAGLPVPHTPLPDLRHLEPEEAARHLRQLLGLSPDGPVGSMERVLAAVGVDLHVLPCGLDPEIDTFSYVFDGQPAAVLNPAKMEPRSDRLALAHELGHLTRHDVAAADARPQEREADLFAAEFLVPAHQWRRECMGSSDPLNYQPASRRWGVSVTALLRRSRAVGTLTERQHKRAMLRYARIGAAAVELEEGTYTADVHIFDDVLATANRCGITTSTIADGTGLGEGVVREVLGPLAKRLEPAPRARGTVIPLAGRRRT